jgi:ribosomal silencing factor RsfS
MDKLIKRGLRNLRLIYRINEKKRLEPINKEEIRKKVQSLHEFEEDLEEWGVGSKFQMEAFQLETSKKESKALTSVSDLKIESIMKLISETSVSENLKFYESSQNEPEKVPQIVLSLPSTPSRRALLHSVLTAFKPLFPKRKISVDGGSEKKADWIVIDLKTVLVHIFDPQTRLEVDLDGKLETEFRTRPDESLPTFMENLSNSLPRSIASRPNFIEKFLKNKKQE